MFGVDIAVVIALVSLDFKIFFINFICFTIANFLYYPNCIKKLFLIDQSNLGGSD